MLTDQVIADGSLRASPRGFQFGLRLPWYRALPLSCVEGLEVKLDGRPAPTEELRIDVEGENYALSDLPPRHDRAWYVTDAATVTVPREDVQAGTVHELDVTLSVRIPYIVESGVPLVMRERCIKSLEMNEEGVA